MDHQMANKKHCPLESIPFGIFGGVFTVVEFGSLNFPEGKPINILNPLFQCFGRTSNRGH